MAPRAKVGDLSPLQHRIVEYRLLNPHATHDAIAAELQVGRETVTRNLNQPAVIAKLKALQGDVYESAKKFLEQKREHWLRRLMMVIERTAAGSDRDAIAAARLLEEIYQGSIIEPDDDEEPIPEVNVIERSDDPRARPRRPERTKPN